MMEQVLDAAFALTREIAALTARQGARVSLDPRAVLDRSDSVALAAPGLSSANGSCRLLRAADGWIALNLARAEDVELVPAWTQGAAEGSDWPAIARYVAATPARSLLAAARLLSLPVSIVGEVRSATLDPDVRAFGAPARRAGALRVVDLSSLWAGPLCGAVFAAMGAEVVKLESVHRPDPGRGSAHHARLNRAKRLTEIDLRTRDGRAALHAQIASADVLITSARPRALSQLGVAAGDVFARNPSCVWIAVSGYGSFGADADRVAFGDDAAAAGGLVRWTADREPRFLGDAIADPLTGLAAAVAGLRALAAGGGVLADAAMARCAAGVAHRLSCPA
jgi:hypothetical protein